MIENGIQRQLTVPYTPQQNGVAERANRTLVEMARCMLVHSKLDESFWAEALATAVYLRNMAATKTLVNKTPYEEYTGKKPTAKHLKTFGSLAITLDKTQSKKFQPKGRELIMVGYSNTSKAYRLMDPVTHKVIISRDVVFMENTFFGSEKSVDMMSLDLSVSECNTGVDLCEQSESELNNDDNDLTEQVRYGQVDQK